MPETTSKVVAPLKLNGLHRAAGSEIAVGHRSLTMLRPICKVCAPHTQRAQPAWWDSCPHEPYVGVKTQTTTKPVYGDGPNGSRIVVDEETEATKFPYPNFVKVPMVKRISSGIGPEYKRRFNGFILPEELAGRSQAFPDGIANTCEFRNCFTQDGLKTYEFLDEDGAVIRAVFCQEAEAINAFEDANGIPQEVANARVRSKQFADHRANIRQIA